MIETITIKPKNLDTTDEVLNLNELEKHRIKASDKIPPPEIALKMFVDENTNKYAILGTLGNFSTFIGKAKAKKTFFVSIVVAALISLDYIFRTFSGCLPTNKRIGLYFDTEQSKWHVQKVFKRICDLCGIADPENLIMYALRSVETKTRLAFIEKKIYETENLGFVVIDGVRDLVFDINSPEEASEMAGKLLKWSEELNIHIITVLHQNKGDGNARGHLGTELMNKSETVLAIEKKENSDISVVTPQFCRNREPEPFAFEVDENGIPFKVRVPTSEKMEKEKFSPDDVTEEQLEEMFYNIFKLEQYKPVGYTKLLPQLVIAHAEIIGRKKGENFLKTLITKARNEQIILQPDELQRGKSYPYILNDDVRRKFENLRFPNSLS